MSDKPVDDGWRIPDELWEHIEPLLPPKRPYPKGGRPRMPDRQAMDAIFFVLRTGCPWKALPRSLGASSTVHSTALRSTALAIWTPPTANVAA